MTLECCANCFSGHSPRPTVITNTPITPIAIPANISPSTITLSNLNQKDTSHPTFCTAQKNMIDGKMKTTAVPNAAPPTAFSSPRSVKCHANTVNTPRIAAVNKFKFVEVCHSSPTENKSRIPSLVPMKGSG
mmetsp:Transcript_30475/g.63102  ORF Transcript_30475/g.63102 Transcript_30475/m.63102 type:complete len:132 (-) Transcript_30475:543-938(-)